MIIFLYGLDTYRSRSKLNEIIKHYKRIHQSGLNLKYFDLKTESYSTFQDEARATSMFNEKKLFIFSNPSLNKNFQESFLKNYKQFLSSKDTFLFYEEKELPAGELFKLLKKNAKTQEFQLLDRERLKNWIKEKFDFYQVKIDSEAREQLINFIGNDLWRLSNEIKKLFSFKKGQKIKKEDIELLVKPKIEADIFETIDAIAQKNKRKVIFLIHKHLEKGDSSAYLFSMIQFQFRNLLIVKELIEKNMSYGYILKASRLHPFVVKKSYFQAKKFTFKELKKIYQKLFQVDWAIKTGKIEPVVALDMLITEI